MTSEVRRAWRLAVFQTRSGLWTGYAGQGHMHLMSRAPTAALALDRLRAIVDEYDAVMDTAMEATDAN